MKYLSLQGWIVRIGVVLLGIIIGYFIEGVSRHCFVGYGDGGEYYLIYLVSVIIALVLYYYIQKLHLRVVDRVKRENEKFYLIQMELVMGQLDPHFIFNALNSISYSINSDDRRTAYSNLGLFSRFLRGSIGSIDEFSRSLQDELDYVEKYLILEKFRFKDKIDYNFIIGPDVNRSITVPKLILFSFIESALKKGILPKEEGGRIDITIDAFDESSIFMVISDNGLHRNIQELVDSHTTNMRLIQRIVLYFNGFNEHKIDIKFIDNGSPTTPKGSRIEIIIPAEYMFSI